MKTPVATAILSAALSLPAQAAEHVSGDAEAGEKTFRQCRACHSIVDAEGDPILRGGKTGPNLWALPGRQAGTQADFTRYGDDLIAAGDAGLVWNEEEFTAYVQDPTGYLRDYLDDSGARSLMAHKVRQEADALDIWAYIGSVSPDPAASDG